MSGSNSTSSPNSFRNPHSLRNKLGRLTWSIVYWTIYRWTPPRLGMPLRKFILKIFGARIGKSWIHPSTVIWAPWLLTIEDDSYVDRNCNLYNAYGIQIGTRVIISFQTTLCTASHDYKQIGYPLIGGPIVAEQDSWIAAAAFICPGVRIGEGAVVAACSVVTRDAPSWQVVGGNPAKVIKKRTIEEHPE